MIPGFHPSVCCFVLLKPTPEEYRVPRVNPGVTASKLFPPLLPSLATPGPPLPYRPLQKFRYVNPQSDSMPTPADPNANPHPQTLMPRPSQRRQNARRAPWGTRREQGGGRRDGNRDVANDWRRKVLRSQELPAARCCPPPGSKATPRGEEKCCDGTARKSVRPGAVPL